MKGTRVSRRSMLGSVGAASLSPALLQASISESTARFVQQSALQPLAQPFFVVRIEVGQATLTEGDSRSAPVTGGVLQGSRLAGRIQGGLIAWRASAGSGKDPPPRARYP